MTIARALAVFVAFVVKWDHSVAAHWFVLVGLCGFGVGGPAFTSYPG
jgi:hypothetical protein